MRFAIGFLGLASLCATTLTAQQSTQPPPPPSRSCNQESQTRSGNGVTAVKPVVVNESNVAVRYYWLDGSGKRTGGGTLQPNERHTLGTYVSHWFVFTNPADGRCLAINSFENSNGYSVKSLRNSYDGPFFLEGIPSAPQGIRLPRR